MKSPKIYEGELFDWFETGLEGAVWALHADGMEGYAGLQVIEAGDHLTILDQKKRVLWKGVIVCDRKTGRIARPFNPDFKQPQALGYWIHWTQKGFEPDNWAGFFIRPEKDRLRGILKKRESRRARSSFAAAKVGKAGKCVRRG